MLSAPAMRTLAEMAAYGFIEAFIQICYLCFMQLDKTRIETIKEYFKTRPVLTAYLFGSYARGEADNQSDIDILVDLDYSQRIGLGFVQMQIDLEKMLKTKVDLVSSGGLSKHIRPIIESEKQLIYAR
jgi:predicted nucleotidyltransferase